MAYFDYSDAMILKGKVRKPSSRLLKEEFWSLCNKLHGLHPTDEEYAPTLTQLHEISDILESRKTSRVERFQRIGNTAAFICVAIMAYKVDTSEDIARNKSCQSVFSKIRPF